MMTHLNNLYIRPNASSRRFLLAGAFCMLGIPVVAAAQMNSSAPMPMHKTATQGSTAKSGKSMELTMSMDNMHKKMAAMWMTGYTDLDFAMMMREHHQGALDMAQVEMQKGKDPQMQKMAAGIVAAQKKEIAEFDAWIKKHEASISTPPPSGK